MNQERQVRKKLFDIVMDLDARDADRVSAARVFLGSGEISDDAAPQEAVEKLYEAIKLDHKEIRLVD